MNKRYAAAVMAALAMAGTVHAQTADQKLRSYETWGSVMGDFNGVSGKDVTYFGANGQPVAEVNYDAYQDGTFEPSGYTYYGYDDNGRVVKEWSQEYKIGTGNVMEWKDKDSIVYQYNDAGYLVSERNYLLGDSTAYEYDADGNKVAMVKYLPDYQGGYTELSRETYRNFVAPNCPQTIVGDGAYASYKFTASATYDADGNMLEKLTYDGETRTLEQREAWTYTDGQLSLYQAFSVDEDGTETPTRKIVYKVLGTDPLRIQANDSTYFDGEWGEMSLPSVSEYFTPQPASAPELSITLSDEKPNTAVLTFNATTIEGASNVAYDVFRHGIKLARIMASEAVDGMITYVDEGVKNGTYDYFVQAVDADIEDVIGDGEVGDDPLNSYGHGMNSSQRIRMVFATELPAPTNVRATKVEYEMGECFVTVSWDEPAGDVQYGTPTYNLYIDGMKLPVNSEASMSGPVINPITGNSYRMSLGTGSAASDLSESVYVEAVYGIGSAKSETVTVTNDTYDMTGLVEKVVEQWGNALGDVPETKISAKTVNYYNADNEVSSVVSYGANLSTGIYEPSYYEGVIFNEKGLPAKRFHQQYGLYDDYDLAYTEANDTTYYKYDENDRLIEEKSTQSLDSIVYEYDADGNMVSKMRYVPDSYGTHGGVPYVMEGYTYSDFVAPNCPQTIVGTGAYASYMNSYKVYYDEDNNIVKKEKYDEGGTLRQVEHWTYELGILAKYEINTVKSAKGDDGEVTYTENPSKKTIYTVVGTNPLRIKDEQMTYTYGEWSGYTYHHVTEYCKPDATTAPKLVVEPVADELNTVMLTFDATDVAGASSVAYDVYRHGIKVARVPASEAVDGMVTYVDNNVYNGSYDYFVQAVDEAADQSGEDPLNSYGYGESVSNTVRELFDLDLPAPSNVRVTSVEYSLDSCYVTLEWDESADKDLYILEQYNVFVAGEKYPVNSVATMAGVVVNPITENKYRMFLGIGNAASKLSEDIYVQAVYKMGKANSDTIAVTNDPNSGIADVEGGSCIRFSHGVITAGEGVTFDVYSADGNAVAVGCEGSLSIGNRPSGVYVVRSHSNGRTTTQKVVLRGAN